MDEAIRKTLSPDYYMTSIEPSYYSEDEDIQLLEKHIDGMSDEEAREIRRNWDRLIIEVQQKKDLSEDEDKSEAELKEYLSQLSNVFIAKVKTLNIPEQRAEKEDFYEKIKNAKQQLDESAILLQSKEYKASPRVKLLILDNLLSLHIQRLRREWGTQSNSQSETPRENTEVSTAPMIFVSVDPDTNRPLYHLIKPAPPIKNLTLRGGGGKGQGYVKMIEVFRRNGIFDHLENVSGSSAGGIAAVALAFGIEDVDNFCSEVQAGIKGKKKAVLKIMPFLKDKFHGVGLKGSAAGIIPVIDRITTQRVQEFLKNKIVWAFIENCKLDEQYPRLKVLRTRALETKNEEDLITFSDLSLVKIIADFVKEQEPLFEMQNNFLNLILTGWSGTETKMIYFSAEEHPNLPIAYAVRVTMSLPGVFQYVRLKLNGKMHKLFDGCVGSNSPSEVFIHPLPDNASEKEKIAHQKTQGETLTCNFDEQGRTVRAESSQYDYGMSTANELFMMSLGAIQKIGQVKSLRADENQKLNATGNVFVVPHGNIGTFDMDPSPVQKAIADIMSELAAENWCLEHEGELIELTSFSLELLLQELSEEQRQQIDEETWRNVLQIELPTHEDVLASVTTDSQTGSDTSTIFGKQANVSEKDAAQNVQEKQRDLLTKMQLEDLRRTLTDRGSQILLQELEKYLNPAVHRDANSSKQKSLAPDIADNKTDITEHAPRDILPIRAL